MFVNPSLPYGVYLTLLFLPGREMTLDALRRRSDVMIWKERAIGQIICQIK